jgi:hypothetical protein
MCTWLDDKNESFNAKCAQNNILGKNANFTSELQNTYFPSHKTHHEFFVGDFRKKIMMNVF